MMETQILFLIKIAYILAIAYVIGLQREIAGKDLGFRSIALVMLGAFGFTYTAYNSHNRLDCSIAFIFVSTIIAKFIATDFLSAVFTIFQLNHSS